MPKLYYKEALALLLRTTPYLLANVGIYLAFGAAAVVYYCIVWGLFIFLVQHLPILGYIWLFGIGGGLGWFLWRATRQYLLYMVRAGHIAVMAELMIHGKLPEGVNQVQHGKKMVQERFRDVSILSAVDVAIKAAVAGVTATFEGLLNLIPIPGMADFTKTVGTVIRMSMSYVDEAILAQSFIKKETNVWLVAKDSVVLYAASWKPILVNAVGLTIISYSASFVAAVIFSIPGVMLAKVFPVLSVVITIAVLVLAWLAKVALADSFAMATTLLAFYHESKGKDPDAILEARLAQLSSKFADLRTKALEAAQSVSEKINPTAAKAAMPTLDVGK